jgi:transposase
MLDSFIEKYKGSDISAIEQFVNGLVKDYSAVKNCLLYPHISNGPIEGINSRTKLSIDEAAEEPELNY